MAKRGRSPGFKMPDEHRLKIQNSNILTALVQHASGERELAPSAVTAGLGLLRKVLPDLSSVELQADVQGNVTFTWLPTDSNDSGNSGASG